ncbi:MAG: hypothetical protein GQ532_18810 [Methylomarinum sp.]|nr:hypothetical protein [Methylomarinum sp.]
MKKILFVLAGGGFLNESIPIYSALKDQFEMEIVVAKDIDYECIPVVIRDSAVNISYMNSVTLRSNSLIQNLLSTIKAFWEAFVIIVKTDSKHIICLGSSMSFPFFFVGKLFNKKTIFIESIARVDKLSKTALILLKLHLVDRCYVQWSSQESELNNSKVMYMGSVL